MDHSPLRFRFDADNGEAGTYSQILLIQEYMNRLVIDLGVSDDQLYPADYFDLMGGVGFGGYDYLASTCYQN